MCEVGYRPVEPNSPTDRLCEYTLEEDLHDVGRVGENGLHNLDFLSDCGADFLEEFREPRL